MKSGGKTSVALAGPQSRPPAWLKPNAKPTSKPKAKPKTNKPKIKHPMDKDMILGVNASVGGGIDLITTCEKGTYCDQYVTHYAELDYKMLFWKAPFVSIGAGYHSIKSKYETFDLSSVTLTGGLHILFSRYFDVMLMGKFGAIVGKQKGNSKTVAGIRWSAGAGVTIPYRPRHAIYRFIVGASYDNYRLINPSQSDTDIRSISIFAGVTAMY